MLSEIGSTGIYEGLIPSLDVDQLGTWTLVVNSASASPAIVNKGGRLDVVAAVVSGDATAANQTAIQTSITDAQGAAFNPTTDSLEAISNQLAAIANSSTEGSGELLM